MPKICYCLLFGVLPALVHAQKVTQTISTTKSIVVGIRKLNFQEPIKPIFASPKKLKRLLQQRFRKEYPSLKLQQRQIALIKLGVLPPATDLQKNWLTLIGQESNGFYDPKRQKLYLSDKKPSQIVNYSLQLMGVNLQKLIMTYYLTLVLLGQNYPIMELPWENLANDDQVLATQALWQGDAMYTMIEHLLQTMDIAPNQLQLDDNFWQFLPYIQRSSSQLFAVPGYFRERLAFPTLHGLRFVKTIKEYRGLKYLDHMYTKDLPTSSEQILHPRKFYRKRDNPVLVKQQNLQSFLGNGCQQIYCNVLGELLTRVMLSRYLPENKAKKMAMGWDGDQYTIYRNGKQHILSYCSVWDHPAQAKRFVHGYRQVMRKKYPDLVLKKMKKTAEWHGQQHQQGYYCGRKENMVLIMEGFPWQAFRSLVKAAWKMETTEYSADFADFAQAIYGFTLAIPSPHWRIKWQSRKLLAEVTHARVPVCIKISRMPLTMKLKKLARLLREAHQRRGGNIHWLYEKKQTIGGYNGHVLRYKKTNDKVATLYEQTIIVARHHFYLFTTTIPFAQWDKIATELRQLLASFKLYE